MLSVILLLIIFFIAYKAAPREKAEHAHKHGAGQIGLLAAVALFGVDYFTSYYFAAGEMVSALLPSGLPKYASFPGVVIPFLKLVLDAL